MAPHIVSHVYELLGLIPSTHTPEKKKLVMDIRAGGDKKTRNRTRTMIDGHQVTEKFG